MATSLSQDRVDPRRAGVGPFFLALLYGAGLIGATYLVEGSSPLLLAIVTLCGGGVFVAFWRVRFGGRLSYADPGIFFMLVICLYTAIPLLTFEYFDYSFGREADARLYHIALDQALISDVWLLASLAMAGFGSAYLLLRSPRMPRMPRMEELPSGMTGALWITLIVSAAVSVVAYLGRGGTGYADEYLFFRALPVIVIQILNVLSVMFQVSAFGLFAYYFATKRPLAAYMLLAASLAFFMVMTDARTMLVVLAGGFFVLRDHLVKRISPAILAAMVVAGLFLFLMLGFVREGSAWISDAAGRWEFTAIFITALDIQQLYITGSTLDMNLNLLLSDVFRLVPQQFLAFEKVDPAAWYIGNFYPLWAESGSGLAFGMLSEAVLTGGPISGLLRGAALGAGVSLAFNLLTKRASLWRVIVYVWVFITLYQCFRDTTFTLVGRFAFQFAPGLLLVIVLSHLLSIRSRGGASARGHPAAPA